MILEANPGRVGYGKLHLYSFIILCASYAFFVLVRESRDTPATCTHHHSMLANLRSVPALLRGTPGLGLFLAISMMLASLTGTLLFGRQALFLRPALCTLILALATLVSLRYLPEPRRRPPACHIAGGSYGPTRPQVRPCPLFRNDCCRDDSPKPCRRKKCRRNSLRESVRAQSDPFRQR